jgi:hypothetical protein
MMLALTGTLRAEEPKKDDEAAKENEAKEKADRIMFAAQGYKKLNNKWPDKLMDMVRNEKEKEFLIDPWGKEYQYKVEKDKAYVWTERTVGKETKVYGAKPGMGEPPSVEDFEKELKAELGASTLQFTADLLAIKDKQLPASLDDLIAKMAEKQKDAEKAAIDPWGKKYQYAVIGDKAYVWTEHTVGKETKVYGKKPPEEKKKEDKKP